MMMKAQQEEMKAQEIMKAQEVKMIQTQGVETAVVGRVK